MLFINSYTKKELDKSGLSMIEYYARLIEDINIGITEIRDYLVNMLDTVEELRTRLYNIKDTIQKDLDTTKAAYANNGYTNSTLDTIQEILDGVEEDLEDVTKGITSTIEAIDAGDDSCEYNITETETPTCQHNEEPFNEEDCHYCAYSSTHDGIDIPDDCEYYGGWGTECNVCQHGDCNVNIDTGEEQPSCIASYSIIDCTFSLCSYGDCEVGTTEEGTKLCTHSGSIPPNCDFVCSHSSPCHNESITDCDYLCSDAFCSQSCNHEMCSQCNYESQYCAQEESTCDQYSCVVPVDCSHDPNDTSCGYDENCGFDYSSGEFVDQDDDDDDIAEDCGDDCWQGDTGDDDYTDPDDPCSFDSDCTEWS